MRAALQSISWVAVLLVGLLTARPSAAHEPLRERIDAFVRAEQKRQGVTGLAVGVVSHGRVVLAKGYGFANLEHQVPVTTETLFQSASVGKQFTTMAVMLLVEQGRISLSDSITKYFPDAPASWGPITLRHLLTHTSGIQDLENQLDVRKDYSDADFVRFIQGLPVEFPAGLRWSYSNSGYVLLGIIVNRVAGTSFVNVLGEQVFKPAGMKTARGISESDIIPNRAASYRVLRGALANQSWVSPSLNTTGDGSLYLSLKDMLAWDAAVERRSLLSGGSWHEILSPVTLQSGATYPYGFGWEVTERNGKPLQQHTGAWQGFKTAYARFIGDSLSIVVLANYSRTEPMDFVDGIAAIVNPALAVPPLAPIPDLEPEVTARFTSLLEQARQGTLNPAEFAYLPWWFWVGGAQSLKTQLQALGAAGPLVLVKREVLGDDRVYTYLVEFEAESRLFIVSLTPDNRVSTFQLMAN
ncbi:beta-lactamase family protein [Pyxidicoccus fallax]|uniref:Beta-lactamase family protein n=1 Tax=Pyxidicoccus fallax TaxID=394095 RepID=A0A848L6U1_9BACT|nr:serine hydrolase domain-containing protein [Pyxidicoccus fallax]NMO14364.1 beta-lactamase family protein [Pyxidicoccus fallax]NPC77153.1 beta-lactamase family protein [Pyxidicoccus fallax]